MKRATRIALATIIEYEVSEATAYTDPVSNTVVLQDIGLFDCLANLRNGRLPPKYLAPLLHEATHHATFDSAVGQALAALASSALGILGTRDESDTGSSDDLTMALIDTITHRFVSRIFEPLIEGLALFAEHDLTPGDSAVVSRPTDITTLLFARGAAAEEPGSDPWDVYRGLLFSVRRSADCTTSKQLLLEQPLYDRPTYLLGYLAVKALYRALARRSPRLADSELFLLLMVDYWFGDSALARLIARPLGRPSRVEDPDGIVAQHRLLRVLEYVQHRLDALHEKADEFSAECEGFFAGKSPTAPSYRGDPDPDGVSLHQMLLVMRYAPLQLNYFFPKIYEHRRDFRFSASRVDVTVDKTRDAMTLSKDGRLLCRTTAVPNAPVGAGEGTVEGIVVTDTRQVALGIFAGDGLVAVMDVVTGAWNPPDLVERLDDMPSAIEVEGVMHALSRARGGFANAKVRAVMDKFDPEAERFVRYFYPKIIFWGHGPKAHDNVRCLEISGLRGVLDDDLFAFLARTSLLCGTATTMTAVAAALQIPREELRQKVEASNSTARETLGMPLFWLAEPDFIMALV